MPRRAVLLPPGPLLLPARDRPAREEVRERKERGRPPKKRGVRRKGKRKRVDSNLSLLAFSRSHLSSASSLLLLLSRIGHLRRVVLPPRLGIVLRRLLLGAHVF